MQSSVRLRGSFRHSGIFCILIEHWGQSNKLSERRLLQSEAYKKERLGSEIKIARRKAGMYQIQSRPEGSCRELKEV
jgi:hypothetical protein